MSSHIIFYSKYQIFNGFPSLKELIPNLTTNKWTYMISFLPMPVTSLLFTDGLLLISLFTLPTLLFFKHMRHVLVSVPCTTVLCALHALSSDTHINSDPWSEKTSLATPSKSVSPILPYYLSHKILSLSHLLLIGIN